MYYPHLESINDEGHYVLEGRYVKTLQQVEVYLRNAPEIGRLHISEHVAAILRSVRPADSDVDPPDEYGREELE